MADIRNCEQCGAEFAPRREHARFCSANCRVEWNRENSSGRLAEVSALDWSVTAMRDATDRLPKIRASGRRRGFAVIGEAVWWVTIVDGTLVRHYPDEYDDVLAAHTQADCELIEGTLAGLRFVRNRIGHDIDHVDFICPRASQPSPDDDRITAWMWKSVPEPRLASLPPRGQAWETSRHRAYEAHLAGHTIGETFGRAAAFLGLAASKATLGTGTGEPAAR
jgi:hypothetical protein